MGKGRKDDATVPIKTHAFKVLAPEALVGKMLGKRGSTTDKEEIQTQTGARLTFSNREEYYPSARLRMIIVHAENPAPVMAAMARLVEKVVECAEADKAPRDDEFVGNVPGEFLVHAAIPSFTAEDVLGYDDYYLNVIQQESGAKISYDREVFENHQRMRIYGGRERIQTAVEKIFRMMDRWSGQEAFTTWAAVRHFPPGCTAGTGNAQAQRPPTENWSDNTARQTNWDQSAGSSAAGGPAEWQADRQYGGSSGSSRGHSGSTVQRNADSYQSGSHGDHHQPGGYSGHSNGKHSDSYNNGNDAGYNGGYGSSYGQRSRSRGQPHRSGVRSDDYQRDRGPRQPSLSRHRRSESRRCSRSRRVSRSCRKSPSRKDPTPPRGEPPQSLFLDVLTAISEDFPTGGLDKDYLVSCDLPEKRIGALIGRRGEHTEFVQRVTGVKVKFEDAHDRADGCRTMKVVGKLVHCYAAHMLMMRRYLDADSDGPSEREAKLRLRLESLLGGARAAGDRRPEATGAPAPKEAHRSPHHGGQQRDEQQERRRTEKDDAWYDIDALARLRKRAEEKSWLQGEIAKVHARLQSLESSTSQQQPGILEKGRSPPRRRSPGNAIGRRQSHSPRRSPRRGGSRRRSRSDPRGSGGSRQGHARGHRSPSHGQWGRNSSRSDRAKQQSNSSGTDGHGGGGSIGSNPVANQRTPNGNAGKGLPESTVTVESEGDIHRCVVTVWAAAKIGRGPTSFPMRGPKRSTYDHAHADGQKLLQAMRAGGESEARRVQRMLQDGGDAPAPPGLQQAPDLQDSLPLGEPAESASTSPAMELMPNGFFEEMLGHTLEEEFREEREGEVRVLGAAMLGVVPIRDWDDAVQQGYLAPPVRMSLPAMGLPEPTLIQRHSVPMISAKHCDVIAESPAGTGKTMAFILPLLSRLMTSSTVSRPHFPGPTAVAAPVLVFVAPARELVIQLGTKIREIAVRAQFTTTTLILCGPESLAAQTRPIERQQFDIVCTTPDRLVEAVAAKKLTTAFAGAIVIDNAEQLVVVEDLDPQVDKILRERKSMLQRQTLMFSCEFPVELASQSAYWLRETSSISGLRARLFMEADGEIDCNVEGITQWLSWVQNDEERVQRMVTDLALMLQEAQSQRALVFVNSGTLLPSLLDALSKLPSGLKCGHLHSRLSERARTEVLHQFSTGSVNILVVSNMACRGIYTSDVGVVLQADMPISVSAYAQRVARVGLTAFKRQALAYVSNADAPILAGLEEFLVNSGQEVPAWLQHYDLSHS